MLNRIRGNVVNPVEVQNSGDYPIIVHCVNDIGKMGSGVARALYEVYPVVRTSYMEWFREHYIDQGYFGFTKEEKVDFNIPFSLGQVHIIRQSPRLPLIANLVGQRGIITDKRPPLTIPPIRYWALEMGFKRVVSFMEACKGTPFSIHLPDLIGCGLAGGDESIVLPIIDRVFKNYQVYIYKP